VLTPLVKDIEAQLRWQAADGLARGKGPGTWGTLGKLCEHCEITAVEYAVVEPGSWRRSTTSPG
jgi:hypothetical protein